MGSPGGFKAHGTGHPSMAPPFAMMMSNLLSPGGGGGGRHHFGGVRPPSPTPQPPQSPQQIKGGSSPSPGTAPSVQLNKTLIYCFLIKISL